MGSTFGRFFRATTFGESHGPGLGVVVDGVPAGVAVDAARIQRELDKRRPGKSRFVSQRQEPDEVEVLSGIVDGWTLGSPIGLLIRNRDARSEDYDKTRELFRPGHADYTYFKKYGLPPQPGGGRASGRETVGRVAAGAVAKAFLELHGIRIFAYTVSIGSLVTRRLDLEFAERHPLRCPDPVMAPDMEELVSRVSAAGDSIGGVIEVEATGVPPGLGDPVFHKLDAVLAGAMVSIGAVKGVEFGSGFQLAETYGSAVNDPIGPDGFETNFSGGILGGISNGEPIVMRLAVKPTPSISKPQSTIDIHGRKQTIRVKGRHDPCLCPRIAPVAEAMAALVLADAMLEQTAATRGTP